MQVPIHVSTRRNRFRLEFMCLHFRTFVLDFLHSVNNDRINELLCNLALVKT